MHDASQNYVPFSLMRELRSGAEDEVIDLPVPKLHLGENEAAVEVVAPEPVAAKVRIEWFFGKSSTEIIRNSFEKYMIFSARHVHMTS